MHKLTGKESIWCDLTLNSLKLQKKTILLICIPSKSRDSFSHHSTSNHTCFPSIHRSAGSGAVRPLSVWEVISHTPHQTNQINFLPCMALSFSFHPSACHPVKFIHYHKRRNCTCFWIFYLFCKNESILATCVPGQSKTCSTIPKMG